MKILLEIKESKAPFILELLSNFSFVKAKALSPIKAEIIEGLKKSVEEVKLSKRGKIKLASVKSLIDE